MIKKGPVFLLLILCLCCASFLDAQPSQPFIRTRYFNFYLNKIFNAHSFLYECGISERPVTELSDSLAKRYGLEPGSHEQKAVTNALSFYQSYFKGKDLVFGEGMYDLKMALIETGNIQALAKQIPEQVFVQLSTFLPVYSKYFWPVHEAALRKSFTALLPDLRKWEELLYPKIASLLQATWKDKLNHVELSTYASWAGAYTSSEHEKVCIVYKPDDPRHLDMAGIEIILHEASHAMTDSLEKLIAVKEKKYNKKIFSQTWHGILFYLTGRSLQLALAEKGIAHEMYMRKEKLFNGAFPIYQQVLERYIKGEISFDDAIDQIVQQSRPA